MRKDFKIAKCNFQIRSHLIRNAQSRYRPICIVRRLYMGQIGADRQPQRPKPIRSLPLSLSHSTSLPLPFDIIDSECMVRFWLLPLAARQPFAYMLPAIWQTAWRKRRLQRRRYNAHVSLIRHETSRRVFERRYNDRGRRVEAKQSEGCEYWLRLKETRAAYVFLAVQNALEETIRIAG